MNKATCVTSQKEEVAVSELVLTLQTLLPEGSPYPTYGTDNSVGLDLPLQEDLYIAPQSTVMTDLGFIVQWPQGTYGMIVPRSSTGKKGLILANTIGIIDPDYCGPQDTLKLLIRNVTDNPVYLNKGDRIAQLLLLPFIKPDVLYVDWYDSQEELNGESRGGFGSTGQ